MCAGCSLPFLNSRGWFGDGQLKRIRFYARPVLLEYLEQTCTHSRSRWTRDLRVWPCELTPEIKQAHQRAVISFFCLARNCINIQQWNAFTRFDIFNQCIQLLWFLSWSNLLMLCAYCPCKYSAHIGVSHTRVTSILTILGRSSWIMRNVKQFFFNCLNKHLKKLFQLNF